MRKCLTMITMLGLLAAPLMAQQGEMMKPTEEHKFLMQGEGTWDAMAKSQGKESKGVLHCKAGLNGFWLNEHYKGETPMGEFEGIGHTTYDPASKKFVNVWIDSIMTRHMVSEGTYDKAKKVLTLRGNMPTPDGKSIKSTITITHMDPNTKVLSLKGNMDGKEIELVEITYKRRMK